MALPEQTNGSAPGEGTDHEAGRRIVHSVVAAEIGIRWWNGLTPEQRRYWLEVAGSARPADAWKAFMTRRVR